MKLRYEDFGAIVALEARAATRSNDGLEFPFVVSLNGRGAYHVAVPGFANEGPALWQTMCTWKHGGSKCARARTIPEHLNWKLVCKSCMATERSKRKAITSAALHAWSDFANA